MSKVVGAIARGRAGRKLGGYILLAGMLTAGASFADTLDDAKALLKAGDSAGAYGLLEPESESRSDPEFDYILGISALDSGKPGVALFAFERVLAADPNHLYARAELVRALYLLGEREDAQRELQSVRALNPPAPVLAKLKQYESAFAAAAKPAFTVSAFIEGFGGYDSNYASATDAQSVAIPAFGNILFNFDDIFVEDGSPVAGARGGVRVVAPVNGSTIFFSSLDAGGSHYTDSNSGFYQADLSGRLGFSHTPADRHVVSISTHGFSSWVPKLNYLTIFGVTAEWRYLVSKQGRIDSFFNFGNLSFDEVIDYRDVRQYLVGSGYTHQIRDNLAVGLHGFGGTEIEQEDRRPDVGRNLYGVRLNASYVVTPKLSGFASVTAQFSDYGGRDGFFLRVREDEQVRVLAGVEYKLTDAWSIRPELAYVDNSSNIPTSDFDRIAGTVAVRFSFD